MTTMREAEQIRQDAYDEGYRDGRESGLADARAAAGHAPWCAEPHGDEVCIGARLEVPLSQRQGGGAALAVAPMRDHDGPSVQMYPLTAGGEGEPGCLWLRPVEARQLVEALHLVLGQLKEV